MGKIIQIQKTYKEGKWLGDIVYTLTGRARGLAAWSTILIATARHKRKQWVWIPARTLNWQSVIYRDGKNNIFLIQRILALIEIAATNYFLGYLIVDAHKPRVEHCRRHTFTPETVSYQNAWSEPQLSHLTTETTSISSLSIEIAKFRTHSPSACRTNIFHNANKDRLIMRYSEYSAVFKFFNMNKRDKTG